MDKSDSEKLVEAARGIATYTFFIFVVVFIFTLYSCGFSSCSNTTSKSIDRIHTELKRTNDALEKLSRQGCPRE